MTYCTFLEGKQAEAHKEKREKENAYNWDDQVRDARRSDAEYKYHDQDEISKLRRKVMDHENQGRSAHRWHHYTQTDARDAIRRHDRRHPDRKIAEAGIFANIDLI